MGIYRYIHVSDTDVLIILILRIIIHNPLQDARSRAQVLSGLVLIGHRHADDDVGSHLPGHIGGIVVTHTTVYEHHSSDSHRCEDGRNSHRGTHGLRQHATMEVIFSKGDHIRCHTGKGNRQRVEVDGVIIARSETFKQTVQILTFDNAAGSR